MQGVWSWSGRPTGPGSGPGSMGAHVGGADVEVTGFRVAEPSCPELVQAVEALLRGSELFF